MKLQMQPERWQCAITSFAMVLDLPVAELIGELATAGARSSFLICPNLRIAVVTTSTSWSELQRIVDTPLPRFLCSRQLPKVMIHTIA